MKEPYPRCLRLLGLVTLALTAFSPGLAGTIPLEWDEVTEPGIEYYVYWRAASASTWTREPTPVTGTIYNLQNLSNCPTSDYHVAVKALRDGRESAEFSNHVIGLPTPFFDASELVPSQGEQGATLTVRAGGWNFVQGATVDFQFDHPGITVSSLRFYSCREVEATITIAEDAQLGSTAVTVTVDNPDGTFTSGFLSFDVVEPPETFAVLGATPTAGATDVDPGTTVQVRFNRDLNPTKVTGKRFKIKRAGPPGRSKGKARLAAGSPRLESDGRTVTMTVNGALAGDERYAVHVKGGNKGVKDVEGNTLPSTWLQAPGFVTREFLEDISYAASPGGSGSSLVPTAEVPADSVFVLEFSELVSVSTASNRNAYIKWPKKGKIPLEGGAPRLSADGLSIILEPAGILPAGTRLLLSVKGGTLGVKSARGVILTESKITMEFTTPVGNVSSMGVAD